MTEQQILEFTLNGDQYCTDIEHVSEIVRRSGDDIRTLPDASPHVEGVMDLRGETTKIIDPRKVLSLDATAHNDRDKIIVFEGVDSDAESIGWAVNDVTRVSTIDTENVEETDEETIKGILNRDEGFLVWTSPEAMTRGDAKGEASVIS